MNGISSFIGMGRKFLEEDVKSFREGCVIM